MQVLHDQHEFTNTSKYINILVNSGHPNTSKKKKKNNKKKPPYCEVVNSVHSGKEKLINGQTEIH